MDFLAQLPARAAAPRSTADPGPSRRPTQNAEEAGALSFSGILEKRQEPATKDPQGQKELVDSKETSVPASGEEVPIEEGKTGTKSAALQNSSSDQITVSSLKTATTPVPVLGSSTEQGLPVPVNMTDLMLRIQTGQTTRHPLAEAPADLPTNTASQLVKDAGGQAGAQKAHAALVDIQPTGGETQLSKPILPLPGVEMSKTVSPEQEPKQALALKGAPTAAPQGSALTETMKPTPLPNAALPNAVSPGEASITESGATEVGTKSAAETISLNDIQATQVAAASAKGEASAPKSSTVPDGVGATPETATLDEETAMSSEEESRDLAQTKTNETPQAGPSDTESAEEKSSVVAATDSQNETAAKSTSSAKSTEAVEGEMAAPTTRLAGTESTPSGRIQSLETGRTIRQQVITQLASSLDGKVGQEKVVLQLNPEKLGQVEIQLAAKGNDLTVVITASNGEAEHSIREGIRELAEGIADKSTRWQQVDIKVEQRGQDQDKNETRNDGRRDQQRRQEQSKGQQQNHRRRDGRPDWASLVGEG